MVPPAKKDEFPHTTPKLGFYVRHSWPRLETLYANWRTAHSGRRFRVHVASATAQQWQLNDVPEHQCRVDEVAIKDNLQARLKLGC